MSSGSRLGVTRDRKALGPQWPLRKSPVGQVRVRVLPRDRCPAPTRSKLITLGTGATMQPTPSSPFSFYFLGRGAFEEVTPWRLSFYLTVFSLFGSSSPAATPGLAQTSRQGLWESRYSLSLAPIQTHRSYSHTNTYHPLTFAHLLRLRIFPPPAHSRVGRTRSCREAGGWYLHLPHPFLSSLEGARPALHPPNIALEGSLPGPIGEAHILS